MTITTALPPAPQESACASPLTAHCSALVAAKKEMMATAAAEEGRAAQGKALAAVAPTTAQPPTQEVVAMPTAALAAMQVAPVDATTAQAAAALLWAEPLWLALLSMTRTASSGMRGRKSHHR